MKCRIQKPIDITKPTEYLIDIVTGKRVLRTKEKEERVFEFSDYLEVDPNIRREISDKRLEELLRDL